MDTIKHTNDKVVCYKSTVIDDSNISTIFEINVYLLFATLNAKYIIILPVVITFCCHDQALVK